jgi:homogentisate 1,2-dioxygenase
MPLLFNDDVAIGTMKPTVDDPSYSVNADGDELLFVLSGGGAVRSVFGDLPFSAGDYVCIPRGVLHRVVLAGGPIDALSIECKGGVGIPRQWRNEVGQLRMDAPYSHRDFRRPTFRGPVDEGIRELVVKRGDVYHGFSYPHSPLDVVGWDGAVYPFAFPILAFQPRVSSVHLPPTWHGTFAARGALVSSFVPRPLDFHPDAIPCPYPHSSVDIDEVVYYASGNFTSRRGIAPGSVTFHPAGIPHGPHPGRYEGSIGERRTEELAVMLDCEKPLVPTAQARNIEDAGYEASFSADA